MIMILKTHYYKKANSPADTEIHKILIKMSNSIYSTRH